MNRINTVFMPFEIERKFTVDSSKLEAVLPSNGFMIKQGYLNSDITRTVRVRTKGEKAFITIKSKSETIKRKEFEYEIPVSDALEMLELCEKPLIEKVRYVIKHESHEWEVDVFDGDNSGLIIAEVELTSEDEQVSLPDWIKEEVSGDKRYFNSYLIKQPYCKW